jgi:hypothetical protein
MSTDLLGSEESGVAGAFEDTETTFLPRIAIQQYKQGHYEIWFIDYQVGKYLLDVFSLPGKRLRGSPFSIDTTTVPKLSSPNAEMVEGVHVCRENRYGFLAASVRGNKADPTPIPITVTTISEPRKVVIRFDDVANDDGVRDVHTLKLYWYTGQCNLFKGAPFPLTKHHESAVRAKSWRNSKKVSFSPTKHPESTKPRSTTM